MIPASNMFRPLPSKTSQQTVLPPQEQREQAVIRVKITQLDLRLFHYPAYFWKIKWNKAQANSATGITLVMLAAQTLSPVHIIQ